MARQIIPIKIKRTDRPIDACAICCIDADFRSALWAYEEHRGHNQVMPIRNAGGPKALTEVGFGYEHIMSQLRFLIREVDIKVIAPMWHVDCRAYGKGHRQLPTEAQHEYYEREMALVKQELSAFGLPVEPVIVHFDGIHIF